METVEEIYNKNKTKLAPMPYALFNYVILKDGIFCFNNIVIILRGQDEKSINTMKDISRKEGFVCFMNSEAGEQFYEEHKEIIKKAFINMALRNAGYGTSVCKN